MSRKKQKLELTWIGKDKRPKLEPRILIEDPELSYHAKERRSENDIFDNMLIQGDNLLALKALEARYTSKVQCVYIDPPFNTGEAMENYDDGIEHSIWLDLMQKRIQIIHSLLKPTGTMFLHIDDNELGYIIAVCDEIFGRKNRISIVTFKQSSVSGPKARNPGVVSIGNFILMYSKDKALWKNKFVYRSISRDDRYSKFIQNFDKGYRDWQFVPLREALAFHHGVEPNELPKKFGARTENAYEKFVLSNADRVVRTARVADKDVNKDAREALQQSRDTPDKVFVSKRDDLDDYYFINGEQIAFYKNKARDIDGLYTTAERVSNIWDDLLSNNLHKEGAVRFPKGKKPEGLIKRCLELCTDEGDLILDSFLGSGTTAAVAHKMQRAWIGVELGEQATTHCAPRLNSVVDGSDRDGISKAVDWKGGGGFRYYRLAPSLLEKDKYGNWVISKEYNAAMLAEAVCKNMGFTYEPSQDENEYWRHGYSTETDFIFVTTASMTHAALKKLSEDVGPDRTLLVCCRAFNSKSDAFDNLTIKKIPHAVLSKCEWGKDDYSLNVANLPMAKTEEEIEQEEMEKDLPLFSDTSHSGEDK